MSSLLIQLITLEQKSYYIQLEKSPIVIGRSPNSDIFLPHPSVSIRHTQLFWQGDHISITDLSSSKGTWYQGERLPSFHETMIKKNEFFLIGKYYQLRLLSPEDFPLAQAKSTIYYTQNELQSLSQELNRFEQGWEIFVHPRVNQLSDSRRKSRENPKKPYRFFVPIDTQIKLFFNPQNQSITHIPPKDQEEAIHLLGSQQQSLLFKANAQELSLIEVNAPHFLDQNHISKLPMTLQNHQRLLWLNDELHFHYLSSSRLVIYQKILYLSLFSLLIVLILFLRYISFSS